jgi:hypothetical protein
MPNYKFVGTDKYQKHWYFWPTDERYEDRKGAVMTPQLMVIWNIKPEDIYPVKRPVAFLEIEYADGQRRFVCPLDAEHAAMIVDRTKNNTLRTHFFMYRGFVGSVPFTYQVHSRYKKYQGLKGTIE